MEQPVLESNWIDRTIGFFSPVAAVRRMRARAAIRHYEAASQGRRTSGWHRSSGDANALLGAATAMLRDHARDLVRNNGHAESALSTIADHVVGWGITGKPKKKNPRAEEAWKAWSESTLCDADGRNTFGGIQKLVMRTVAESGEALVRLRYRRPGDEGAEGEPLPLPLQLQVLEPDYLDTCKTGERLPNGGFILGGIEYDYLGRRAAYWMFREHPGSAISYGLQSYRIPAEFVRHIYRQDRPGQMRGATWFAPVLLKFKEFDAYDDATLMKQKIAACLAIITSGDLSAISPAPTLGGQVDTTRAPEWDLIEPGAIIPVAPGSDVQVVSPPSVRDYPDFVRVSLHTIAAGLGVTYEDLTGDYTSLPYSAARMSRLRHWGKVNSWRWLTLVPQLCDPVWRAAMVAAVAAGKAPAGSETSAARWTAPPMPMLDPDKEGRAFKTNIRSGLQSLSEALRERGYDPEEVLREIAADNKLLDQMKLILDSDPRNTTEQGLARQSGNTGNTSTFQEPKPAPTSTTVAEPEDGEDEEEDQ